MGDGACGEQALVFERQFRCLIPMIRIRQGKNTGSLRGAFKGGAARDIALVDLLVGVGQHDIKVHQIIIGWVKVVLEHRGRGLRIAVNGAKGIRRGGKTVKRHVAVACGSVRQAEGQRLIAVLAKAVFCLDQSRRQGEGAVTDSRPVTIHLIVLVAPRVVQQKLHIFCRLPRQHAGRRDAVAVRAELQRLTQHIAKLTIRQV